jgi:hypothetical protein
MNRRIHKAIEALHFAPDPMPALEAISIESATHAIPWFIRLITIFGSIVAALVFVGFLALAGLLNSGSGLIAAGVILMVIGAIIALTMIENPLMEPFLISASLLGQILFAVGLYMTTSSMKTVSAVGIGVELVLFLLFRSQVQRFASVILLFLCWLGLLWNTELFEASHALIGAACVAMIALFYSEEQLAVLGVRVSSFFAPTMMGLVFALLALTILSINNTWFDVAIFHWWISTLLILACLMAVLWDSLRELKVKHSTVVILLAAVIGILAPTIQNPGVAAGVFLLVLGGVFFAVFIASFYYSLQMTLLSKSYIMLSTGGLFLLAYWCVHSTRSKA